MRTAITNSIEQVSITEHPDFHKPKNDWRVIPERWKFEHDEWDQIIPGTGVSIPEDRSQWIPEEDGKSMADFWDYDKEQFKDDSPFPAGITTFLKPVTKITENES